MKALPPLYTEKKSRPEGQLLKCCMEVYLPLLF